MIAADSRAVLTLDAGGTNFVFSAIRGGDPAAEPLTLPAQASDLSRSLANIKEGFQRVRDSLPTPPVAISFAFPGPCDYANGIVLRPPNMPAYRDVPLAPLLEDTFALPVFINNDGDLFAFGEAIAGFLPYVNRLLERADSPKRYRNLFGVTLGTGFGGGFVRDGQLVAGDNSGAGEIWLLRHKLCRDFNVEEGVSIRAIRRSYAEATGVDPDSAPQPKEIFEIAEGRAPGDRPAAHETFRRVGEIAGDAIAQATTLFDGLVVIGGGIAGAHTQFLPALVDEMNGTYTAPDGEPFRRLVPRAFNLENPAELAVFLKGEPKTVTVPGSGRQVRYDAMARIGVGISRLGASEAIAIGAWAYALSQLGPA